MHLIHIKTNYYVIIVSRSIKKSVFNIDVQQKRGCYITNQLKVKTIIL